MKKEKNRIQQRQRQKMTRKTIIILAAGCMTCMVIILTIFFNMSHVDQSMADNHNGPVSIYTVVDEEPIIVKTLDAPVVKQMPLIGPNTQLVRNMKVSHDHAEEQHN